MAKSVEIVSLVLSGVALVLSGVAMFDVRTLHDADGPNIRVIGGAMRSVTAPLSGTSGPRHLIRLTLANTGRTRATVVSIDGLQVESGESLQACLTAPGAKASGVKRLTLEPGQATVVAIPTPDGSSPVIARSLRVTLASGEVKDLPILNDNEVAKRVESAYYDVVRTLSSDCD